jgi:hypothetical protein
LFTYHTLDQQTYIILNFKYMKSVTRTIIFMIMSYFGLTITHQL